MKEKCKLLYFFCVRLLETFVSLLSVCLFSSFRINRKFEAISKMIAPNKECRILCNGPSLMEVLAGKGFEDNDTDFFVVNFFATTEYFTIVKPNNYIILDPNLRNDNSKHKEARDKLIQALNTVDWNMNLFVPIDVVHLFNEYFKENSCIKVVEYNHTPISGFDLIVNYLYRKSLGMPRAQNILNAAIFCAINLGYSKIYIYGAEHSWTKNFDVDPVSHRIFLNDCHFYKSEHIRYMPKGDYAKWLRWIAIMMETHEKLREYADTKGARVVNKTPGSFIEYYDYKD